MVGQRTTDILDGSKWSLDDTLQMKELKDSPGFLQNERRTLKPCRSIQIELGLRLLLMLRFPIHYNIFQLALKSAAANEKLRRIATQQENAHFKGSIAVASFIPGFFNKILERAKEKANRTTTVRVMFV